MILRLTAALLLATASTAAPLPPPAPIAALVKAVDIPFEQFKLANGLTVVVHTDRKAPVVATAVWYHVGSKDEPAGKTGFAHLFEHLMFYGSENHDDEFFKPLENAGATDYNGTTSFDRTNYFQTVPTPALNLALFLESDRMGHLLGAVSQRKLDAQRAVVKNEKRENENQPFGQVDEALYGALFPASNPYRHTTIGSMTDIGRASLDDVRGWFRGHYGPNNAVLVLAGDIDLATARAKVETYFGDIARGPDPARPVVAVQGPSAPVRLTLHDRIAAPRLYRSWVVPGDRTPDSAPLDIAAAVLGGGGSSRLYGRLVRGLQLAVDVSADTDSFEKAGVFTIVIDLKPGADPVRVQAEADAVVAQFLREGPTADEVSRVATRAVAGTIRGLESVGGFGGKAVTLAEGATYAGDPGDYKRELAEYARATPAEVLAAARRWITKPDVRLTVLPGARTADVSDVSAPAATPDTPAPTAPPHPSARGPLPAAGAITTLSFPAVERAKLSNGAHVVFARRTGVPIVRVLLSADGGVAADPADRQGLATFLASMLDEGTTTRSAQAQAEDAERYGAAISAGSGLDRSRVSLFALTPNLAGSLDLLADEVLHPALAPQAVERVRGQLLARIAEEGNSPSAIALRALPPLIYGPGHPYAVPFTGTGTVAGVNAVTRADLVGERARLFRPETTTIFVVGDTTLAQVTPMLERAFAGWIDSAALPAKAAPATRREDVPEQRARVLLYDRPGSPQSLILGGLVLTQRGTADDLPLSAADDVLGGSSLSRLNLDIREKRGWAYGVSSAVTRVRGRMPLLLSAPVQTDRTGASLTAIIADMAALRRPQPVTEAERDRTVASAVRSLPGSFESGASVLSSLERNLIFERPDDYQVTLARRYGAITAAQIEAAAQAFDPARVTWIVVGDRARVEADLRRTGLPVEVR